MPDASHRLLTHLRTLAAPRSDPRTDRELLRAFATGRDEQAFAVLVRRHGAMVLAACRRVLRDRQEAEDACQAVFVLLAKRAGDGRWRESVGGWLHEAAVRTALHARVAAARRRKKQPPAPGSAPADPLDTMSARELRAVLDEELNRLPADERAALVLCFLEGLTRDEAARRLGCSLATLRRRLGRGRDRLRSRLERRGVGLSAGLVAALAAGEAEAMSPRLAVAVEQAAAGGAVSPAGAVLGRGAGGAAPAGWGQA